MGKAFLTALSWFERIACALAFIAMAGALIADVGKRELGHIAHWFADVPGIGPAIVQWADHLGLGSGILGAPQIGVIGMIVAAMFGFGLAAQSGAQLRPRFLDFVIPKAAEPFVMRLADLITAFVFALLGWLCTLMVAEAYRMGDVTSVLRWPIWPMQAIIALAFATNALRYLVFALEPSLRPQEDVEPDTAGREAMPGADDGKAA